MVAADGDHSKHGDNRSADISIVQSIGDGGTDIS